MAPEALLIVDYQNDFTPPDGALAVPEGDRIASRINELAASDRFDVVIATRDWHPPAHGSFEEHGGPWPRHCVQGTPGAELDQRLEAQHVDVVIDKGQDPGVPGYSAFEEPALHDVLHERGIRKLTIAGLAADVCVRESALGALRAGYGVIVDEEATRGVDPENTARALEELRSAGAEVRAAAR